MRALKTKSNRLAVQQIQFDNLINRGFKRENYGDLSIFTMTDDCSTWLKVFRAAASHPIEFKRYKTKEQADIKIKDLKASHDRSKAYKAELKNNPTKSSAANCAAAIRDELKKEFPNVKFSVKSSNFAGGDSVHVEWSAGPTTLEVSRVTSKYQYGRFDGMTDMYENTNSRSDIPQSKYIQTRRNISEEITVLIKDCLRSRFSDDTEEYEIQRMAYQISNKYSIPVGAVVIGLKETNVSGSIEDSFCLDFDLSKVTEPKQEVLTSEFEKVEVPDGEIQIIDYSERAIAVIGDTKPIKDKLKDLGGKFNFRLSCGAGWIFPKTKLTEIENLLTA